MEIRLNYFAYGSNMDVARMREEGIDFRRRVAARLPGYRLEFNKLVKAGTLEGHSNIVPDEGGVVEGALYDIDAASLPLLDKCEGYPGDYLKIAAKVFLSVHEQEVCAITYIANPKTVKAGLKPAKDYLDHLLAAKDILPAGYLEKLRHI